MSVLFIQISSSPVFVSEHLGLTQKFWRCVATTNNFYIYGFIFLFFITEKTKSNVKHVIHFLECTSYKTIFPQSCFFNVDLLKYDHFFLHHIELACLPSNCDYVLQYAIPNKEELLNLFKIKNAML